MFLPSLMWQRMQRSECCSVGCVNQWLKTEICSYLYLDATCAWPSPECHDSTSHPLLSPRKPQPNRHVPSHPSKTVLLFEVTVPLVVGQSIVYLFTLVPIARTPPSYAACFCAWPNAVNISQGGERAERARTAEPPSAAAPGAEERPTAGEDTGSKQTSSAAVGFALAFLGCGCLDTMDGCDVSLLPNFCHSSAVPWLCRNHSSNRRCETRQIPKRGGALCFKFLSLVLCRLFSSCY